MAKEEQGYEIVLRTIEAYRVEIQEGQALLQRVREMVERTAQFLQDKVDTLYGHLRKMCPHLPKDIDFYEGTYRDGEIGLPWAECSICNLREMGGLPVAYRKALKARLEKEEYYGSLRIPYRKATFKKLIPPTRKARTKK